MELTLYLEHRRDLPIPKFLASFSGRVGSCTYTDSSRFVEPIDDSLAGFGKFTYSSICPISILYPTSLLASVESRKTLIDILSYRALSQVHIGNFLFLA